MKDEYIAAVGQLVVQAREEKGWSQLDLSKDLGIFKEQLARLEEGIDWPSVETLAELEDVLGWTEGVIDHVRSNYEYFPLETLTLALVKKPDESEDPELDRWVDAGMVYWRELMESTDWGSGATDGWGQTTTEEGWGRNPS